MPSLVEKIWRPHRVAVSQPGNSGLVATTPGGADLIAIDRIFLHERTGAAALKSMAAAGRPVRDPARVFVGMDHIVDTRPGRSDQTLMPGGQGFISETRAAARAAASVRASARLYFCPSRFSSSLPAAICSAAWTGTSGCANVVCVCVRARARTCLC